MVLMMNVTFSIRLYWLIALEIQTCTYLIATNEVFKKLEIDKAAMMLGLLYTYVYPCVYART